MYFAKDTDETLIIRGYSWHRFALALVFLLCTPLWVWLLSHVDEPTERLMAMGAGVVVPFTIFKWVWDTYENWQLVFESDYNLAAIYKGRWGTRQTVKTFPLSDVSGAALHEHTETYRTKSGQTREKRTYHVVLNLSTQPRPIFVGQGDEVDVYRIQRGIKMWLNRHERRSQVLTTACSSASA
ncbi:hypothetical protein L0666_07640 [Octadecabacter sp. CECT 8868]|uniref:hypothetical protein n=1 Tax=Octadecabacter algicola TaxID=2909342 RepID=UPI001F3A8895|nr:hypothetical protein [Octadecabacter algicola]MCF2904855.1 hypothetical protein [Octadecabacter algicola]